MFAHSPCRAMSCHVVPRRAHCVPYGRAVPSRSPPLPWPGMHAIATPAPQSIWTIGHSSRTSAQFVALLQAHEVRTVADVRRHAGSRKHPQFGPERLAHSLAAAGIGYEPFADLGGRRPTRDDSPHAVWRNASFRGYADYMDTEAFATALERLMRLARTSRTAVMCSEAVWWRCHRSLIADALKAQGTLVLHILGEGRATEHPYTTAATIVDGELHYGAGA